MYDIATTGVTTSDKKSMSANAYVTWRIVDVEKYYKTLNSVETAQSRIDTFVYFAIKNVISSTTQAAANARETISNAEAEAASIIAQGESEYYQTLAEAYSKSESKTKFYTYWTELEAMKQALSNGGTLVITEDNPLYQVLIDAN